MTTKTPALNKLHNTMLDKGFDVRMAYINRLRILDLRLKSFPQKSTIVQNSINVIGNQTYEEMYDHPSVKQDEYSLENAKARAQRFEEIYDALQEFSLLAPETRSTFIKTHKPKMKQLELFSQNVFDEMRGRS